MNAKQICTMMGRIVEHQLKFSELSTKEGQWVIKNPKAAIELFIDAVKKRAYEPPVEDYVIDCDSLPFCPKGFEIYEHRPGGRLKWDAKKISLYWSKSQIDKEGDLDSIKGFKIKDELSDVAVLNACVIDYLEKKQSLILFNWKYEIVYFWGTIYRHLESGMLYVRYLKWNHHDKFISCWQPLDYSNCHPAAILR